MYKKYGVCIKKKINAFRSKQLLNNLCEKKQVTRNCLVEITSFFFSLVSLRPCNEIKV